MNKPMTQSQTQPGESLQLHTAPPIDSLVVAALTHDEIARSAYDMDIKAGRKQDYCTRNGLEAEQWLRNRGQAGVFVRHSTGTRQGCIGSPAPACAAAGRRRTPDSGRLAIGEPVVLFPPRTDRARHIEKEKGESC